MQEYLVLINGNKFSCYFCENDKIFLCKYKEKTHFNYKDRSDEFWENFWESIFSEFKIVDDAFCISCVFNVALLSDVRIVLNYVEEKYHNNIKRIQSFDAIIYELFYKSNKFANDITSVSCKYNNCCWKVSSRFAEKVCDNIGGYSLEDADIASPPLKSTYYTEIY